MFEEELVLDGDLRESTNDSTAVGQPCGGVECIRFRRGYVERGILERVVEIYRRGHVRNGALSLASETTADPSRRPNDEEHH